MSTSDDHSNDTPESNAVLVQGSPPLTEALVQHICAYFEWILDVKLDEAIRGIARASIVEDWTNANWPSISMAQQTEVAWSQLATMDPAIRAYVRETNQPGFVENLRRQGSELTRAMLEVYDAANMPIAPGGPPLTREMADSYLDRLAFMTSVVNGLEYPLTADQRTAWIDQLVAAYPNITTQQRFEVATAPLAWAALKAWWTAASELDRAMLRQQWAQHLSLLAYAPPRASPPESPVTLMPEPAQPPESMVAAPERAPGPAPEVGSPSESDISEEDALRMLDESARHARLFQAGLQMNHDTFMSSVFGKTR